MAGVGRMLTEHKLGLILSRLEEDPNPEYALEQYSITPGIAAHMLFLAKDDVKGKAVYDLGCGTGRLAIGAALLEAREAVGVDIDREALRIAGKNARYAESVSGIPASKICRWLAADVFQLDTRCDVVIQFPPFELGYEFFKKALGMSDIVYSINKSTEDMERLIRGECEERGFSLVDIRRFRYKLAWKEGKEVGFEIMLSVAKKK